MSADRLIKKIMEKKSVLCVGLDPVVDKLPNVLKQEIEMQGKTLEAAAEAVYKFNTVVLDAVAPYTAVVKPQVAFYEALGVPGLEAYRKTIEYAKKLDLYVIADIKRGDIGTTSEAYAQAHLGYTNILGEKRRAFESDAVTINPYLGDDSNHAFSQWAAKEDGMTFLLVKTSNKTSSQLQNQKVGERFVFDVVGDMLKDSPYAIKGEYGYTPLGAVVGATHPEELSLLRSSLEGSFFLIPGYGAQGGSADDATNGFDERGLGAVVNSSRGVIYAFNEEANYGAQIAEAAQQSRDDLNAALERAGKTYWEA
ncbi:orotidine-5'-phosphate decarboxylase [Acidaminobacter sp.]|uniref:orotidine-5'-phosphate decarboxylase n=1 Tax=Acidaminobacter sp. TaxID=1872102 RepID=UPI0013861E07|nr:orotidine-5'-phosphate decarboxylase [Acidaminobacter sp.]MDK9711975.1 orotidine-5'-phosphate decarboxylase [Acidaminobacter sp.]MZQ98598.1 orotidine-5'-phosphate decarboxylase [Acidaminobacter sp.]